jgi:probable HAF family extracellular repeat protein
MFERDGLNAWGVACCVAVPMAAVAAPRYEVVDVTPPGAEFCHATAINASGQVAGWMRDANGVRPGFVTDGNGANPRIVHALRGDMTQLRALSDQGIAVGTAYTELGQLTRHPIVVMPGSTTAIDLGTLGGNSGTANAINEKGHVVGSAQEADGTYRAFSVALPKTVLKPSSALNVANGINESGMVIGYLEQEGQVSGKKGQGLAPIGPVNGGAFGPLALSDRGTVVGYYNDANGDQRAAIADAGGANPRALDVPGRSSHAFGINRLGRVVGWYWVDDSVGYHAFAITPAGKFFDLNDVASVPGGDVLESATAINDAGQIAAYSWTRCYRLTPTTN